MLKRSYVPFAFEGFRVSTDFVKQKFLITFYCDKQFCFKFTLQIILIAILTAVNVLNKSILKVTVKFIFVLNQILATAFEEHTILKCLQKDKYYIAGRREDACKEHISHRTRCNAGNNADH